ncbi:MAG: type 2 lanthipeptide synthetase LanM [Actinomycetota bacterium]
MLQPHATRDAWLDVFALYPVLARVVGTASFYWREATLELIARVAADRTLLAREFADGAPIACVDSIESDAGDVHRGGRAVAIVGFDGGRHVVYKPKNLDVGAALVGLLGELSTESAGVSPRSIVTRGAYTWEQFVPTAPTDDPGVARFYRRYGELIRIVQALGGYDITYENLVAHGDRPEIIDLETMFRAPSRYGDDSAALDLELLRRSLRGPGATAMLSTGVGADVGRRALRMSPLEADDSVQAPFRQPRLQRDEEGRFRLGWEYTDSPRDNPVPQVDGVGADPREHLDEVLVGYRNMDERLAAERSQLTAPDGPLAQLGGAPVRFLNRNSYIYSRMIQQSLSPDRLVDGVRREIEIDRFWKSLTVDPHGAAFIADEVNAVRQLDIPLMQSLPGSTDVILNDERVAADVFHRPALPGLLDELASLNAATRSTNLALVRSHLHCIDPRPQLDRLPTERRTPSVGLGDAVDIARAVAEQAVQRDGRVGWTGLSYNPTSDLWSIGRLPIDLLSGIAGIGIALAEIAVATADARTTTLAETTFDTLCAAAKQIPAECERARTRALTMRGASFIVGGLTGIGAPLHGIARIAHLLDLDRGRAVLEHALEEIDVEVVRLLAADDVVGGLPGLLDNLSVVRRYIGHGAIDQIIDELSVERTDPPPPPIPDGSWILEHAHVGWEANGVGHAGGDSRATSPVRPIGDVHLASSPTLLRVLQARPTADAHSLEEALGELARRRSATGSWFPDLRVDPRHHLSAVYGMCAVGRAIVQLRSDVECPPLMVAPTR